LFIGAEVTININGGKTKCVKVLRGVRQRCLLAPYLFLFIGEALNIATKRAQSHGSLIEISLPFDVGHQLIIQLVDDMNFTIRGTKENMNHLIDLLELFYFVEGLKFN